MKPTSIPPFRVQNQELSLWQSVVASYALKETTAAENYTEPLNLTHVQEHPMVSGTTKFAKLCEQHHTLLSHSFVKEPDEHSSVDDIHAFFSAAFFHLVRNAESVEKTVINDLCDRYRKFSDKDDCGWAYCLEQYLYFKYKYRNEGKKYVDWYPKHTLDFGVIDYKLPNDAKVAIIGDWGTGMQDARRLLEIILKHHKPDAIIHLGDIYYAGTPEECNTNFAAIFTELFTTYPRVPVFTIPGNHDYYAFAYGYYAMVSELNVPLQAHHINAMQPASYFCLRTEDNGWQFLGMDTGYDDSDPTNQFNIDTDGPFLHPNEPKWHQDKLSNFDGATIVLSHHQLYSGNTKINGSNGIFGSYPYLNKNLLDLFRPYFGDKIAAWLWGHEHNQIKYKENLFGLPTGRLIGASAYEEIESEDPYRQNFPEVPISSDPNARLDAENGYYNHGFSMIDFSQRSHPKDAVVATYYQFPSWGKVTPFPIPKEAQFMWRESFALQPSTKGKMIKFGDTVHLNLELGNAYIGKEVEHFIDTREEYLPTIQTTPVALRVFDGNNTNNPIQDGDEIYLITQEPKVGKYNYLGAWEALGLHHIYYYSYTTARERNLRWKIKKVIPTPSDPYIRENEAVFLFNDKFPGKYLCPYLPLINDKISTYTYLTVNDKVTANWFLQVVQSSGDDSGNSTTDEPADTHSTPEGLWARVCRFFKELFS